MPSIHQYKELEVTETPLLLFDCQLSTGAFERFSTHQVTVDGQLYKARVQGHNLFDIGATAEEGVDGLSKVSLTLANADSYFSQIERNIGWKGAKLSIRFLFYDLKQNIAASESMTLFQGIANPPDEITEATMRLAFTNRLSLQRVLLPDVHIQKRCPWVFPSTLDQRQEAVTGGMKGKFSPFFRCGYSPDVPLGTGNLNVGSPFTSCGYTRSQCMERGMFRADAAGNPTRRFGGVEFVPSTIQVRSYGEKGSHFSAPIENQARYDDFVPLAYGVGWYQPPIVFARNDGNLTHLEILLGMGEIQSVIKTLVNEYEIPAGQAGANMTATGWYNVVSFGNRTGDFNLDFATSAGQPLGDPYGSMAVLSVVVPNRISDGRSQPRVQVLLEGMKLSRYDVDGSYAGEAFSNNPAWVLLDVLRRSGWSASEIDLASFARVAQYADEPIPALDLYGNSVPTPRFQCNLVLRRRRSAADVVRGIRTAASLYLSYGPTGQLQLRVEASLAVQQGVKPASSNSTQLLNGGWPAYEFGDTGSGFSGILRRSNGEPSIRVRARSAADTPNRYSVEYQDVFNEYQQDSLSLIDFQDVIKTGHEATASLHALGIPTASQAARIIRLHLDKAIRGNTFFEFETSVRGIGLKPGDIITVTYLKEGFQRQPFRILRISPAVNFRSAQILAQIHDDSWYSDASAEGTGERRQPSFEAGRPRPLVGKSLNAYGDSELEITENAAQAADGSMKVTLSAGFVDPRTPSKSSVGIPLLSLAPGTGNTGGTLAGGQTLYYAVSAVDSEGGETQASFIARATISSGTNTNSVTLNNLSFGAGTSSFHVYRGKSPVQLLRIAANAAVAAFYADTGAVSELAGPPDENYDHANVYWRLEQLGETSVTSAGPVSVGNSSVQILANEYRGMTVRITSGKGAGQERAAIGNDATMLQLATAWGTIPDATSKFVVAESGWHFGASGRMSPIEFEIPNRESATLHVSARSANVADQECAYELSPLSRWQIGGAPGFILDDDAPPLPVYGLFTAGEGTVELVGVSFTSLLNTRTLNAATLTLWYWDELTSPSSYGLSDAVAPEPDLIALTAAGAATVGDLIQIDSEVMSVVEILSGGLSYRVSRGSHSSVAAAHAAQSSVYHLQRKIFIAPFSRDFFGSPASGSYSYPVALAGARIAAAELFVSNVRGDSPAAKKSFTGTTDRGLRTMSGGQLSIQVEGHLAIQADAAPPLIMETAHAVRDVFASVREAPTEFPIEVRVKSAGTTYCNLTIPTGATASNVVDGFGLPPLAGGADISIDIVSVGQTATSSPGRDLTVTLRL